MPILKKHSRVLALSLYLQIGVNVIGLPDFHKLEFFRSIKELNVRQRYSYLN